MNSRPGIKLSQVVALTSGKIVGPSPHEDFEICGIHSLEQAKRLDVSFYRDRKFLGALEATQASAVFVPSDFKIEDTSRKDLVFIGVTNPVFAFAKLATQLAPKATFQAGIHPSCSVDSSAAVDASASLAAFVSVGARSFIGAQTRLYENVFIDSDVVIGKNCVIYPHVSILKGSKIGDRAILHSGVVIGSDGFGYTPDPETQRPFKVPQLGRVRIGDDVEIGANSTVDRATVGWTVLEAGTKVDNLVQIGHNCHIGENAIICAQVGISGSVTVGKNVVLAGQVGTYSHVKIGDNVTVTARGGISKDIPSNLTVKGYPAVPIQEYLTIQACVQKLPELREKVLELEKRLLQYENASMDEAPSPSLP